MSNKGILKEEKFKQGIPETSKFEIRVFLKARNWAYDHKFGDVFSSELCWEWLGDGTNLCLHRTHQAKFLTGNSGSVSCRTWERLLSFDFALLSQNAGGRGHQWRWDGKNDLLTLGELTEDFHAWKEKGETFHIVLSLSPEVLGAHRSDSLQNLRCQDKNQSELFLHEKNVRD